MKGVRFAEVSDLSCMVHTLQFVINDGLSSQKALIDIIAKQRLKHIQEDLGLPEYNFIQAIPT